MSFPLLRLPLLASINVIQNTDVKDFINIIRTSTRTKNLIKLSKVPIHLDVFSNHHIEFKKLSDPGKTVQLQLSIESDSTETSAPFAPYVRQIAMHRYEENLDGYQRILSDFVDIFHVKSANFDMRSVPPHICVRYLEYALSRGLRLEEVRLLMYDERDEYYSRRVLEMCANARELDIVSLAERPIFDVFGEYSMDTFELAIHRNRGSFKIDHLYALVNCSNVIIRYVELWDHELNRFLKFWMTSAGKLKSLIVVVDWTSQNRRSIKAQTVMYGIPRKELRRGEKFEIKRSDGTKAIVWCQDITFTLGGIHPESVV